MSVTNFNGTATYYNYDDANRLVSLQNKRLDTETVLSSYTYTLDGNGNRTQVLQEELLAPIVPSDSTDFTYNSARNRLLSAGSTNFTYDDEGQLATKDAASYSFDYEHRLVIARSVSDETIYTYDGKGNRLQATRNGIATRYIYDASGNLLAETDSANNITRYYIYGRGLLAMATPTGEVYTYHYNGIGSTVAMTNQNKTVVNRYFYTPFGLITNQDENIHQPFKYAGKYGIMSESSGLYYMRARYYDPAVGRFISEDPIGFEGGINLYAYVNDNPINFVDPWGLEAGSASSWTDVALQGIGIALVGLTVDDVTFIGIADDPLIPVLLAAGVGVAVLEARKFGQRGSLENPIPFKDAPGPDYWETPQGENQPPRRPGREGWWIVGKILHAISEAVDHFIQ